MLVIWMQSLSPGPGYELARPSHSSWTDESALIRYRECFENFHGCYAVIFDLLLLIVPICNPIHWQSLKEE